MKVDARKRQEFFRVLFFECKISDSHPIDPNPFPIPIASTDFSFSLFQNLQSKKPNYRPTLMIRVMKMVKMIFFRHGLIGKFY